MRLGRKGLIEDGNRVASLEATYNTKASEQPRWRYRFDTPSILNLVEGAVRGTLKAGQASTTKRP